MEENRSWEGERERERERKRDRQGLVATCRIALLRVTERQTDWEHRWLLWDGSFCDRTSSVPYQRICMTFHFHRQNTHTHTHTRARARAHTHTKQCRHCNQKKKQPCSRHFLFFPPPTFLLCVRQAFTFY